MYAKISKWIMWALIIVSAVLLVLGFVKGFDTNDGAMVDVLLRWGYVLLIAAVALVIILGVILGGVSDPKSLVKLGIGLVLIAVLAFVAYLTASGAPLVGFMGDQPSASALKLTDTLLNLTYFLGGGAILAIIVGEVVSFVRK